MNENCTYAVPDYVISIFWFFISVVMISMIIGIIIFGLRILCEIYQERQEAYLANKRIKLQNELLERQKNAN